VDTRRFGRPIRTLRRHHGLRQADVAGLAHISDSTVSRIELGRVGRVPFATLRAVGDAVEAEVELMVRWQAEGLDRLLDEDHSSLVAAVVDLLRRLGWEVAVEVSFAIAGERGSVDVLACIREPDPSP
jgi:transcriptional regulator with XRE-family HTH domain